MMDDAERGRFERLVVKDISRLARNTVDLLQSVRRLKALGIQTLFLTANMDAMGDSEFILTLFGALAQEESANMSKRIKFGKRLNAERGKVPNLVYGYDKAAGDCFHLAVNPREAAVIRQIFDWYIRGGYGTNKIAAALNQQGCRTKQGYAWSANAVGRILANPLYTGKLINGKQEVRDFLTSARVNRPAGEWLVADRPELRIVSDEQFRQAGAVRAERNRQFRAEGKRQSSKHLFSSLIRCKECGRSFRRVSRTYRNTYVRWVCGRRNGEGADQCPNAAAVEEGELIGQLDQYFRALLGDRDLPQALLAALRRIGSAGGDRRRLRERLAALERERQTCLDLYAGDLITRQELDGRLRSTREETGRLERQLERLKLADLSDGAARRLVSRLPLDSLLSVGNLDSGQLKQLISRIEAGRDGQIDVYLQSAPEKSGPLSGQPP